LDLISLLRKQIVDNIQIQNELGLQITYPRLAITAAA